RTPSFSFLSSLPPPALPSFPTRRSSDLQCGLGLFQLGLRASQVGLRRRVARRIRLRELLHLFLEGLHLLERPHVLLERLRVVLKDRKSTRLNSSHVAISYAVFCLKTKTK